MSFEVDDAAAKLDEWAEARGIGQWTCDELGQAVPRRAFIEDLVWKAADAYATNLSEEAYEQGHEDGYDEGYESGYDVGHAEGYQEGYIDASNGYEK